MSDCKHKVQCGVCQACIKEVSEQREDRITELEAERDMLRAVIDEMATDPSGEHYYGLDLFTSPVTWGE